MRLEIVKVSIKANQHSADWLLISHIELFC